MVPPCFLFLRTGDELPPSDSQAGGAPAPTDGAPAAMAEGEPAASTEPELPPAPARSTGPPPLKPLDPIDDSIPDAEDTEGLLKKPAHGCEARVESDQKQQTAPRGDTFRRCLCAHKLELSTADVKWLRWCAGFPVRHPSHRHRRRHPRVLRPSRRGVRFFCFTSPHLDSTWSTTDTHRTHARENGTTSIRWPRCAF